MKVSAVSHWCHNRRRPSAARFCKQTGSKISGFVLEMMQGEFGKGFAALFPMEFIPQIVKIKKDPAKE